MPIKYYRLRKNLPTFKAGDEFSYINGNLIECKPNGTTGICLYSANTLEKFPNILTDWFEEINESTRWKPEVDQEYYCLGSDGSVMNDEWVGLSIDCDRFKIGNCFQTEEEAEQVVEYLKALAVVRGDATSEFVKYNDNWFIGYDPEHKSIDAFCNPYTARNGIFGLPYFATREDAQRSIKQHKKQWLTIFGVKGEDVTKK